MIFWVLTNVKHIWSVEQENVSLHRFSVVTHKHKAHLGYFNQHMESSSKVRSVTRTADGDSLFFVPIHGRSVRDGSIHHASFRLETKSASGTQGRSARIDWRRHGKAVA